VARRTVTSAIMCILRPCSALPGAVP